MVDRADMDYIKKMAKDVCHLDRNCDECNMAYECKAIDYATRFYDAHYRKTEWISVEERLPTHEDGKVLIYTAYGVSIAEITINGRWRGNCAIPKLITHWMPLPMPPKGDEGK